MPLSSISPLPASFTSAVSCFFATFDPGVNAFQLLDQLVGESAASLGNHITGRHRGEQGAGLP